MLRRGRSLDVFVAANIAGRLLGPGATCMCFMGVVPSMLFNVDSQLICLGITNSTDGLLACVLYW